MPRLMLDRWRYRWQFVGDLGTLAVQALRRAGLRPRDVVRAVLVLATWAALLVALTVFLVRR